MTFSFTGIAYLTLLFTLGYLDYRFFQYWRKEKDAISKYFFYFISFFWLFALVRTIGGLFYVNNPSFLEKTLDIGAFIQAFAFAVVAYIIVYIKFPKISPWFGFILILILGLITAAFTIITSFNPQLELSGAIDWGSPSSRSCLIMSILKAFLFCVTFIPLTIIFLSQFKTAKDPYTKRKTLGISFSLLFITAVALFDVLFLNVFKLGAIWRDIGFIIFSIILLITLILTLPRSLTKS